MRRSVTASLLFLLATSIAGQAQTPPPAEAPQASEAPKSPAAKRVVLGDWALICATAPGATEPSCEIDATLQPDSQLPPVAKIAFVRGAKDKPARLVAIVPANLTIERGVEVAFDPARKPVVLGFRSCLNSACLADSEVSAEDVQSFRSATQTGRLTIRNAAGEELSLQVPFRGLDKALDALLAQSGQ